MPSYATDGSLGVDITLKTTGTTTDGENAIFKLGSTVVMDDGAIFQYVQAGGAITQYDCVGIDENFQATALTNANAIAGYGIGFAQVAFANNNLGWVCIHGKNITCRVKANCAKDVGLYTTSTAGVLDDTSKSGTTKVNGVAAVAAVGTSAGSVEVIANYPTGTTAP